MALYLVFVEFGEPQRAGAGATLAASYEVRRGSESVYSVLERGATTVSLPVPIPGARRRTVATALDTAAAGILENVQQREADYADALRQVQRARYPLADNGFGELLVDDDPQRAGGVR